MIRLFVTGDNHIGLKYANHPQAAFLASSRISAFDGMVSAANRDNCDLFVITGDLFENTYSITKREIKPLLDMLSKFKGTVVVLPGNHDYYDAESKVWQYFKDSMGDYDNIMLLTDYRPYELTVNEQAVVLYPALCTSLHSVVGQNNLGWIKNADMKDKSAYHIGIAHGSVEGETIDNEGRYFLMKRSELESIPVDVWLIGHTHVPFPRNLADEFSSCEKIFNAGTHLQTDVVCNTEGQCFIIEISEDKKLRAKRHLSGTLRFFRKRIEVTAGCLEQTISRELSDIPDNSVVDIILAGAVSTEEYENRHTVIENSLSRFVEGSYSDYQLSKLISKEVIDAEFSETSFSAGLLTSLLDTPKEAQLAYELLKTLKGGK